MIEVEQLRKQYGDVVAVKDVSFTAQPGEIFGLLGPNGAGKTTTIGCISSLLTPTAGHIRVTGHDVVRDGVEARRSIGVVPQEIALYEDLSARENLSYWGGAQGLRGSDLRTRIDDVLELTGLLDRAKEPIKRFSGGMKRRLNFACGIIHRPRVLLLDEPTVGVDPQSRVRLLELVRDQAREGACVLYTTHYMEEAQTLCDRLAIIDHGSIIAQGTLAELRALLAERDLLRLTGVFRSEAVAEALAKLDGVEIIQSDEAQLSLSVTDASHRLPAIFAAVNTAGEVRGTTLTQPSLESLFIKLTGKELRVAMRFVLISAAKDLRRIRRDPVTLLTWLGIPLFIAVILVVIFGRGNAQPNGKLLIVNEDQGIGATLLTGAFSQGALAGMISTEGVDREEGRRRINKGDASALLIIPKDFTSALLNGTPSKLQLIRNPAQRILPSIIEEVLSMLTDGVFYLHVVAGDQLKAAAGMSRPSDSNIAEISAQFNQVSIGLRRYLSPPLIELETQVIKEKTDKPGGFAALMLPGMLYMAVFFIAGGLATDVWRERTSGGLRRVLTTPASFGAFLGGKLVGAFIVLALVGAFGLVVGHFLADLQVSNFPLAIVWIALSGTGLYLFMMLVQSLASTERVANMLANFVLLPFAMLGGSFFPFDLMPKGFAQLGKLTPNGWSVLQLQNILGGVIAPAAFAGVVVFIAAGWMVVGWRVRRTAC